MAAAVTANLIERDEPIARVAECVLQRDQLGRILVEPFESIPDTPDRASEAMQRGQVVRLAREPAPAIACLSNEVGECLQGTVARHGRHRAQRENDAGGAIASDRAAKSPPRLRSSFVQIGCPLRRWLVLELHVVVSNGACAVTQPAQVVLKHAPGS
jgi:hypothetical protein